MNDIKIDNSFNKSDKKNIQLSFDEISGILTINYSQRNVIKFENKEQKFHIRDLNRIILSTKTVKNGKYSFSFVTVFLGVEKQSPFAIMSIPETGNNVIKLINEGEKLAREMEFPFYFYKRHGATSGIDCFIRDKNEIGRPFFNFFEKDKIKNNGEFTANENINVEEDVNGRININYYLPNYKSALKYWGTLRVVLLVIFVIVFFGSVFYFNPPGTGSARAETAGINMLIIMAGFITGAIFYFFVLSRIYLNTVIGVDKNEFYYCERLMFPILVKRFSLSSIKYFRINTSPGNYDYLIYTDKEMFRFSSESSENMGHFISENLISAFNAVCR